MLIGDKDSYNEENFNKNNAKEDKIKKAYGDIYDWDENGWLIYGCDEANEFGYEPFGEYETRNHVDGIYEWRPKSLQGIENNNGWIKIESEKDLPKEDCNCHIIYKNGIMSIDKYFVKHKNFNTNHFFHIEYYQPIQKPSLPIYQIMKDFDINKEIYTTKEISKLINKSQSYTYRIIITQKLKPVKEEITKNKNILCYYHKFDVYKLLNLAIYIVAPKKERKLYFEFAYQSFESKIFRTEL